MVVVDGPLPEMKLNWVIDGEPLTVERSDVAVGVATT